MAYIDGCWFVATSSGTGSFVPNTAVPGFKLPVDANMRDGFTYAYRAESQDRTQWEEGWLTCSIVSTVYTLARTYIRSSSNSGSAVSFTVAPRVAVTISAMQLGDPKELTTDGSTGSAKVVDAFFHTHFITTDGAAHTNYLDLPTTGLTAEDDGREIIVKLKTRTHASDTLAFRSTNGVDRNVTLTTAGDFVRLRWNHLTTKWDILYGQSQLTSLYDARYIATDALSTVMTVTASGVILGRKTASAGHVEELLASDVRTLINVANGATANDTDSNLKNRTNHTGTQLASTISDFSSATNTLIGAAGLFVKAVDDTDDITVGSTNKFATAAEKTKLGYITVTSGVDLDDLATKVAGLDQAIVLKGTWAANAGTFPGSGAAQAGWEYIVSTGGTVGGVVFNVGDRVIAITDNASTSTYAGNWFIEDYTDAVSTVAGKVGTVTIQVADLTDMSADARTFNQAANYAAMRTALNVANGATANTGTVTSVQVAVPTGFSVSGGPVTVSGTVTIAYAAGYQGYTTTEASKLAGIASGAQTGTVTSVQAAVPTGFSVSGGPITGSGTLTIAFAGGYQGYTSAEATKVSNAVLINADATIGTAGYQGTEINDGSKSSGTYTPTQAGGNFRLATNAGAFTLAAPAANSVSMVVRIINGATAGAITMSGFHAVVGDSFDTTNGSQFMILITHSGGLKLANVVKVV